MCTTTRKRSVILKVDYYGELFLFVVMLGLTSNPLLIFLLYQLLLDWWTLLIWKNKLMVGIGKISSREVSPF